MLNDFKTFIMRGNVLDLAVAVVIGGAFGKITSSFVNDILMPPIGLLLGNVNFADLFISLSGRSFASLEEAKAAGAPTINYGVFLNTVIDFLLIALAMFLIVRAVNRLQKPQPAAATTKDCPFCFMAIPLQAKRCGHCTSQLE